MTKMEKNIKQGYFTVASLVLFLIIVLGGSHIFYSKQEKELEANLSKTKGIIVRNYKDANSSWMVEVHYSVNGLCYYHNFYSAWSNSNRCIGDSLVIEYSSIDPNNARAISPKGKHLYPGTKIGKQDYTVDCNK